MINFYNNKNDNPIFIGGLQRSGTSLLRAIIGSHPDIAIYQWDLRLWTYYYIKYKNLPPTKNNALLLISDIFSDPDVRDSDIKLDQNEIKDIILKNKDFSIPTVFKIFLSEYARKLNKNIWGLKTPHNEFFAEQIFHSYPNAKFIHLIRDPRDVAVSYRSYDNGAWYYNSLEHIKLWKRSVRIAKKNKNRWPSSYEYVTYEDIVSKPVETIQSLCDFLQVNFVPEMLMMKGHIGWNGNNSFFDDFKKNEFHISKGAIGRFETKLEKPLVYMYQKRLKDELYFFNYSLLNFSKEDKIKLKKEILRIKIVEFISLYRKKIIRYLSLRKKMTFLYRPAYKLYHFLLKKQ